MPKPDRDPRIRLLTATGLVRVAGVGDRVADGPEYLLHEGDKFVTAVKRDKSSWLKWVSTRIPNVLRDLFARLDWTTLRGIGTSRLARSSFVWLFVVPVAAKLLRPISGDHIVQFPWLNNGEQFTVEIALPFSWVRFWLMAWSFFFGQLVFRNCCPEIVRKYTSFGEFRADHAGGRRLESYMSSALCRIAHDEASLIEAYIGYGFTEKQARDKTPPACVEDCISKRKSIARTTARDAVRTLVDTSHGGQDIVVAGDDVLSFVFDGTKDCEKRVHRFSLAASATLFALGLFLFGWVLYEGTRYVVEILTA